MYIFKLYEAHGWSVLMCSESQSTSKHRGFSQVKETIPQLLWLAVYHQYAFELKIPQTFFTHQSSVEKILRWLTDRGFFHKPKKQSNSFSALPLTCNNDTRHSVSLASSPSRSQRRRNLFGGVILTLVGTHTYVHTHECQLTANQDKRSVVLGGGKILRLTVESYRQSHLKRLGKKRIRWPVFCGEE